MTDDFTRRNLDLFSEGTRIAASLFVPTARQSPRQVPLHDSAAPRDTAEPTPDGSATIADSRGHPAILLAHGWGGLRDHLVRYAELFVRAGHAALIFDYRGWGASDGRVIYDGDIPLTTAGVQTLPVRVLRDGIDPIERAEDIVTCLNFLATEPGIDPARIGLWGTSYGGGNVAFVAGNDDRVKAVVAQIGGFGFPPEYRDAARVRAGEKARGSFRPVVPQDGLDGVPGLNGTPDIARMAAHSQLGGAARIHVPTLIIDAEFEELNNRLEHGWAAYMMVRQNAPAAYHTFPSKHYAVYDAFFDEATALALDWYRRYL